MTRLSVNEKADRKTCKWNVLHIPSVIKLRQQTVSMVNKSRAVSFLMCLTIEKSFFFIILNNILTFKLKYDNSASQLITVILRHKRKTRSFSQLTQNMRQKQREKLLFDTLTTCTKFHRLHKKITACSLWENYLLCIERFQTKI